MTIDHNCPNCGTTKILQQETRKYYDKKIITYRCKNCLYKFTIIDKYQLYETFQPMRRTYTQNWTTYNQAQTNEKETAYNILNELLDSLQIKYHHRRGRPKQNIKDMIFSCFTKIYLQKSSRRTISELKQLEQLGYINKVCHFNTILKYLNEPDLTPILKKLIEYSSQPLKMVETEFAADSSGFTSSVYGRWHDYKHTNKRKFYKIWKKCHIMVGVKTNIITSVEVTHGNVNDSTQFQSLLQETGKNFHIKSVAADKAYSTRANLEAVTQHDGATPYIPFRSNVTGRRLNSQTWRNMYDYYMLHRDEFMNHYHLRSNVETTFSMIKTKFGSKIYSRNHTGQVNEVLIKVLAHNLCVLVSEICEFGYDFGFQSAQKIAIQSRKI